MKKHEAATIIEKLLERERVTVTAVEEQALRKAVKILRRANDGKKNA